MEDIGRPTHDEWRKGHGMGTPSASEAARAAYDILSQGLGSAAEAEEVLVKAAAQWDKNFFRHGVHPGTLTVYCRCGRPFCAEDLGECPQCGGRDPITPQEATCKCGRTYYADEGSQCPQCMKQIPTPFLLRDQCGGCGMPCSADWCPYCEGCHDSEEDANASRRATEFAVKQQEQAHAMLTARDRVIDELRAERERCLHDMATLRRREEGAQKHLAAREECIQRLMDRLDAAATEVVRLRDQQARARNLVASIAFALVSLCGAGALAWLWWDRLPHWSPSTWSTVAVGLGALLLGRHWPRKKLPAPTGDPRSHTDLTGQPGGAVNTSG